MSESTAIALRVNDADLARIESIANECSLSNLGSSGRFMRAFKMAAAIRAMRQAITKEMMQDLMELQGTKLGFRTDKDKDGGYPPEVVKDCAIEATLRGGYWIGNEFNIIASSCYLTKEYFIRILREFPGLTDLRLEFGAPVLRDDKAWVACKGSWKLHGRPDFIEKRAYKIDGTDQMLDERLVIKCNKFMGEDAVLGKAERKLRAAIYSRITGTEILEGEADEVQEPTVRKLDDLANRLEPKTEQPPKQADESSQASANKKWAEWAELFEACPSITETIDLKSKLRLEAQADEDKAELERLWTARGEAIRALRGERNKQTVGA